jgi:hypothetical protein
MRHHVQRPHRKHRHRRRHDRHHNHQKKDRVCACKHTKAHVSAHQQQISARQHQNANNDATNCARESNKTSVSLRPGTYSLRDAPFDTTSDVRIASTAAADTTAATTTTGKGPRECVQVFENTRVSATTTKSTRDNIKTQTMMQQIVRANHSKRLYRYNTVLTPCVTRHSIPRPTSAPQAPQPPTPSSPSQPPEKDRVWACTYLKAHVSVEQQQISARHHENANNDATNCTHESNQKSASLQHGTYSLHEAPFDKLYIHRR